MKDELVTIPGILLSLLVANRGTLTNKDLHKKMKEFSERDVDEALTFLTYKGLVVTHDHKPNEYKITVTV